MSDINKGSGVEDERDPLDFSLELSGKELVLAQKLKLGDFDKDEQLRADFSKWDAEERLKVEKNPSPMAGLGHMVKTLKVLIMARKGDHLQEDLAMDQDLADIYLLANGLQSEAARFSESEKAEFNNLMDQVDAINAALNPNPDQQ